MSVSMLKRAKDHSIPDQWIDIATNRFFEDHWLPLAQELELELVPMMWEPFHLNEEHRIQLIEELRKMRQHIGSLAEKSTCDALGWRIDGLISALESGSCDDHEYGFG